MNTGIADAHNLAWKLALVLGGIAGPALLGTYEHERRPVAQFTLDQSMLRMEHPQIHFDPTRVAERVQVGIANPEVVHLGYRYASEAIIAPCPVIPSLEDLALDLDASPGTRLPHGWVDLGGARCSTLDLVADRFTIVAGPQGQRWCAAARTIATRLGLDLAAYRIGPDAEVIDADGRVCALLGVQGSGALLIRPDGFIAWRASPSETEPEHLLERVIRQAAGIVTAQENDLPVPVV